MDQRIKGQEVQIMITRGGVLEETLTDIQSFNVTLQFEMKSVGYLHEKSERKDNIFKGIKLDMSLHIHKQAWFTFAKAVVAKAKGETPDVQFNITGVFNFPNRETPTMLIQDVAFGDIPHDIGSRGDYVNVKLSGEAYDWDMQVV